MWSLMKKKIRLKIEIANMPVIAHWNQEENKGNTLTFYNDKISPQLVNGRHILALF